MWGGADNESWIRYRFCLGAWFSLSTADGFVRAGTGTGPWRLPRGRSNAKQQHQGIGAQLRLPCWAATQPVIMTRL